MRAIRSAAGRARVGTACPLIVVGVPAVKPWLERPPGGSRLRGTRPAAGPHDEPRRSPSRFSNLLTTGARNGHAVKRSTAPRARLPGLPVVLATGHVGVLEGRALPPGVGVFRKPFEQALVHKSRPVASARPGREYRAGPAVVRMTDALQGQ